MFFVIILHMKRVFIVHGWGGSPSGVWIPWLRKTLEARGYQVTALIMPNTDAPVIKDWIDHLYTVVGTPDKKTYFIGHSIGCQTILRYLETVEEPIGGAVFVAGWFKLENLEDEDSKEVARPWTTTPIDLEKIKKMLPKSVLIISDDDPYGAFEENKQRFSEFISREIVLPNAGHIESSEEPAILAQLLFVADA